MGKAEYKWLLLGYYPRANLVVVGSFGITVNNGCLFSRGTLRVAKNVVRELWALRDGLFVNMLVRFLNVFLLLLRFPFFLVSTMSKVHPGWVITDCRSLLWMILILRLVLMHALTIWGRTY